MPDRCPGRARAPARLLARHDAVRHAPPLRRRRQAPARRLHVSWASSRRGGDVPRRPRAVARRSRRRRDHLVPQGRRGVPAHRVGRGGAVPQRLARVQPRPLQARRSRRSRIRSRATRARSGSTTTCGSSAWRTTSSASGITRATQLAALAKRRRLARGRQGHVLARAHRRAARQRRTPRSPATRTTVSTYPFSWYALLARARLAALGVQVGPFGDDAPSPRAPSSPRGRRRARQGRADRARRRADRRRAAASTPGSSSRATSARS